MAKNRIAKESRLIQAPPEPPDEEARRNGSIVRHLQETLGDEETFRLFPTWLVEVLKGDLWRRFALNVAQELLTWDDFDAFVKARRPRGLGIEEGTGKLYVECRFFAEQGDENAIQARALLQRMMPKLADAHARPENQNARKAEPEEKNAVDIINPVSTDGGTSETYLLRRLKRDRPDLAEKVVKREMSAHAAAREAGIRKLIIQVPPTVEGFTRAAHKHLSTADVIALKESL